MGESLIATVNEQAKALQRAAFSPIVREAGDLANGLFDRDGRMVAQAVTGTPGHINSLARRRDGHPRGVPDRRSSSRATSSSPTTPTRPRASCSTSPCSRPVLPQRTRVIAFFGSTIHHTDVGGYGIGAGARDVFEEGLWIPICKLLVRGERNDDVWKFILSNVRQPDHMAGDLHAQIASGEVGAQRLNALCDAHGLDDIDELGDEIIRRSEDATRAIDPRACRGHVPRRAATLDLADGSIIEICCCHHRRPGRGRDHRRLRRSSGASPYGINVVKNYTHAYTTFTVRSVLNPEVPNNHGSLAPDQGRARPRGRSSTRCRPRRAPRATSSACSCPNALIKALAQIRPDQAMAEGSGAVWTMQVSGNHDDGRPFITAMFTYAGGVGARATKPGLGATSYPTGVAAVPIEVVEASAPVRFLRKALRARQRRSRRADRRPRPDHRVHRRHRTAVAAQRGDAAGSPSRPRASSAVRRAPRARSS